MARMKVVLQLFRVATVAAMGISATLATMVTGGVLLSTVPVTPGTGTCFTLSAMWAGATAVRGVAFLCVA